MRKNKGTKTKNELRKNKNARLSNRLTRDRLLLRAAAKHLALRSSHSIHHPILAPLGRSNRSELHRSTIARTHKESVTRCIVTRNDERTGVELVKPWREQL